MYSPAFVYRKSFGVEITTYLIIYKGQTHILKLLQFTAKITRNAAKLTSFYCKS